ncbi:thymidylate synthase [Salmonella phage SP-3]|uniref:thymidylate synthase n=1 Tax=Salmonella phage SP-3 TaxID=1186124 RepID=A0A2H4PII6_9CAUD|nr:thymidylate synthase [Salmonella phage SP3]ATW62610.1 thymidylate synthase [Salmonella phage SP3]
MKQYIDLINKVLSEGTHVSDRTGVGTISSLNNIVSFDLTKGFPAVTTKALAWKSVVGELLWFLSGSTNLYDLEEYTHGTRGEKRTIWHPNYEKQGVEKGYTEGYLGYIYGKNWRDFFGTDQIMKLIEDIKSDTFHNRKMVVSAWNPAKLDDVVLSPCHVMFSVNQRDGHLHLTWYQVSCDVFLGLPFNIASYALLCHILAALTGKKPGSVTGHLVDTHIYLNHLDQVKEQVTREPLELPRLVLPNFSSLEDLLALTPKDFILEEYKHHPKLTGKMAA